MAYDWLRFWWDLATDQAVTLPEIMAIWDDADPHSWNPTDSGPAGGFPANRLRNGANANGLLTEWDAEDNANGVHR